MVICLKLKDDSFLSILRLAKTRYSPQKFVEVDLELGLHEKYSQISNQKVLSDLKKYSQIPSSTSSKHVEIPIDRSSAYSTRQAQTTTTSYLLEQHSSSILCSCGDSCSHDCKKDTEIPILYSLVSDAIQTKTPTTPSSGEYSSSLSCSCGDSCPSDCQKVYDCCDRESCDSEIVDGKNSNNETKDSRDSLQMRGSNSWSSEINQKKGMELTEHNQISEPSGSGNARLIERERPKLLPVSSTGIRSLRTPMLDILHIADNDAISLRSPCAVSIQITRANSTGTLFDGTLSETDLGYTSKDLSAYLGMKDQISKSILQHEVCIFRYLKQTLHF